MEVKLILIALGSCELGVRLTCGASLGVAAWRLGLVRVERVIRSMASVHVIGRIDGSASSAGSFHFRGIGAVSRCAIAFGAMMESLLSSGAVIFAATPCLQRVFL